MDYFISPRGSKQIGQSVLSECKDWVNLKKKTEIIEVKIGLNAIIPPLLTKYFCHFNFLTFSYFHYPIIEIESSFSLSFYFILFFKTLDQIYSIR